jgi:hypothetical protein
VRRIWFEGETRIMLEGDRKVSIADFEGCPLGGLMDAKCYLALGLGTVGVPRGFSSFRPGISDIFLELPGVLDGTAVANGSDAIYVLVQSTHAIKFVNCNRLKLQDL